MNLLADESVDGPVVDRLRQQGHEVVYVAELSPGMADDQVLQYANEHNALLLTADKDFGELVFRLGRAHRGVVLLRLAGLPEAVKAERVASVFRDHAAKLVGGFSVVSSGALRIRPKL